MLRTSATSSTTPSRRRPPPSVLRRLAAAFLLAQLLLAPAALAQDFPKPTNFLVDDAGVISPDDEARINAELNDYEERSSNEVAVAVVESTGNRSIQDYANDLFAEWGVGKKGEDNGVLTVIAMKERETWIEVGYGMEGELTDLEAGRIYRDVLRPLLREGDVGNAVLQTTRAIRRDLGDDQVGEVPVPVQDEDGDRGNPIGSLFWLIPFFIFGPLSAIGRRGRRRRGWITPIFWGGGWGGLGGGGQSSGGFGGGGGGFGGFGGGNSGGGGAGGSW
jgi:uncharacterized protein